MTSIAPSTMPGDELALDICMHRLFVCIISITFAFSIQGTDPYNVWMNTYKQFGYEISHKVVTYNGYMHTKNAHACTLYNVMTQHK